jgi:hypothetical protein
LFGQDDAEETNEKTWEIYHMANQKASVLPELGLLDAPGEATVSTMSLETTKTQVTFSSLAYRVVEAGLVSSTRGT